MVAQGTVLGSYAAPLQARRLGQYSSFGGGLGR